MSDSQNEGIRYLSDPANQGGAEVAQVETHGAHVFLAGEEPLKVKRAVRSDASDAAVVAKQVAREVGTVA